MHDEEAKRLYDEARPSVRKRDFEDEFMRFSNHMLCEVDRKIAKGKQRLQLMNKNDALQPGAGAASGGAGAATAANATKYQDHISDLSARIKKLIGEAEEAGNRGDVDQAQGLMTLCDQLKDEKDALVRQLEGDASDVAAAAAATAPSAPGEGPSSSSASVSSSSDGKPNESHNGSAGGGGRAGGRANNDGSWPEFHSTEKQMEVCEVCGAFLIVGDAQQRLEDHLTGKQHMGYSRLRKAVDEMSEKRMQERDEEVRQRYEERRPRVFGAGSGSSDGGKWGRKRLVWEGCSFILVCCLTNSAFLVRVFCAATTLTMHAAREAAAEMDRAATVAMDAPAAVETVAIGAAVMAANASAVVRGLVTDVSMMTAAGRRIGIRTRKNELSNLPICQETIATTIVSTETSDIAAAADTEENNRAEQRRKGAPTDTEPRRRVD